MVSRLWLSLCLLLPAPARAFQAAAGRIDISPDFGRETIWLAGFGPSGRRSRKSRDSLNARGVVVSDGKKTVALVAVDSIGLYRGDVERIRRRLGWQGGDKYLFVAATHSHSTPDTLGLWGRLPGLSGVNRRYHERLLEAVVSLVRGLSAHLEEAQLVAARADLDPRGRCTDTRDPVVIDPELDAFQLRRKSGSALATVLRWSCHPEVLSAKNRLASADFPGAVCDRIEAAAGGACVYFSGVVGGLLTPEADHSAGPDAEYVQARLLGEDVADAALEALRQGEKVGSGKVAFDSRIVRLPVDNSRYLLFLPGLAFGHDLYDAEGRPLGWLSRYWLPLRHLAFFPLPEAARPRVETEASLLEIGPVKILGIPGELFPELAIGGYDGRYRYGHPLIRPGNSNPPRLEEAPKGPYLREQLKAKVGMLVGLANDEIGYIVPQYDFQVRPSRSMLPRLPGTHYEETQSIGPSAAPILLQAYDQLLAP